MPKDMVKIHVLVILAFIMAGRMATAQSLPAVENMTAERSLGNQDAKLTVVEYASLTCPHCAAFHNGAWRTIKKEYVDTGKIKYIFRDFPLDRVALAASMIARCAPADRYFGIIGLMFKTQDSWRQTKNPKTALENIARLAGMSNNTVQSCLQNQEVLDAIMKQRNTGDQEDNVKSTPTLVINGQKFSGGLDIDNLRKALETALAAVNEQ